MTTVKASPFSEHTNACSGSRRQTGHFLGHRYFRCLAISRRATLSSNTEQYTDAPDQIWSRGMTVILASGISRDRHDEVVLRGPDCRPVPALVRIQPGLKADPASKHVFQAVVRRLVEVPHAIATRTHADAHAL
jgi:hypothetical protein